MIAPHHQSLAASAMSLRSSGRTHGSQYYMWPGPDAEQHDSAATLAPRRPMAGYMNLTPTQTKAVGLGFVLVPLALLAAYMYYVKRK